MKIKRGDICYCKLYGVGSVQKHGRPCVVLSNNKANIHSPVITVAPITSKPKHHLPTHVMIELNVMSCIMLEQITTIDKSQILEYIGVCDSELMNQIEQAMFVQLAIDEKAKYCENRELKKQLLEYKKLLIEHSLLPLNDKEKKLVR